MVHFLSSFKKAVTQFILLKIALLYQLHYYYISNYFTMVPNILLSASDYFNNKLLRDGAQFTITLTAYTLT